MFILIFTSKLLGILVKIMRPNFVKILCNGSVIFYFFGFFQWFDELFWIFDLMIWLLKCYNGLKFKDLVCLDDNILTFQYAFAFWSVIMLLYDECESRRWKCICWRRVMIEILTILLKKKYGTLWYHVACKCVTLTELTLSVQIGAFELFMKLAESWFSFYRFHL